jgi:hypothetical protein
LALLEDLRERINLRLEESFVGISEVVGELAPEDLVELLNQLTLVEAATVVMMLPVPRIIRIARPADDDAPRPIIERLDPKRAAQVIEGLSADERTDIVKQTGLHERRRILAQVNAETRTELRTSACNIRPHSGRDYDDRVRSPEAANDGRRGAQHISLGRARLKNPSTPVTCLTNMNGCSARSSAARSGDG